MEANINAAISRVQEIQARIDALTGRMMDEPLPSASAPIPPAGTAAIPGQPGGAAQSPFSVIMGLKNGDTQLRPISGGAGPFRPEIESLITKYAQQNGLPPELVRAVVQQESSGNPRSHSAAGAMGLMQLMPGTASAYGVQNPYDPEENIAAGTKLLSGLMREFNGDLPKMLAAYNAGSGAVKKYGGVPPYAETQQYVRNIMGMLGQK